MQKNIFQLFSLLFRHFVENAFLRLEKLAQKYKISKLAYNSKGGKCMKQMSIPPSLEVPFLVTESRHFCRKCPFSSAQRLIPMRKQQTTNKAR